MFPSAIHGLEVTRGKKGGWLDHPLGQNCICVWQHTRIHPLSCHLLDESLCLVSLWNLVLASETPDCSRAHHKSSQGLVFIVGTFHCVYKRLRNHFLLYRDLGVRLAQWRQGQGWEWEMLHEIIEGVFEQPLHLSHIRKQLCSLPVKCWL